MSNSKIKIKIKICIICILLDLLRFVMLFLLVIYLFADLSSFFTYTVLAGPLGDRFCNPHVVIFLLSKHHHHHHHQIPPHVKFSELTTSGVIKASLLYKFCSNNDTLVSLIIFDAFKSEESSFESMMLYIYMYIYILGMYSYIDIHVYVNIYIFHL